MLCFVARLNISPLDIATFLYWQSLANVKQRICSRRLALELVDSSGDEAGDDETEFETPSVSDGAEPVRKRGTKCLPSVDGAVTSNETLIQWLPKKKTIAELIVASEDERIQQPVAPSAAKIRVTYQMPIDISFAGTVENVCGRTLEEAFGLENAMWCQAPNQKHLGLKLRGVISNPTQLAVGLNKRVTGKGFDKTKFALGVLTEKAESWNVPAYIKSGLVWLSAQVDLESPSEDLGVAEAIPAQAAAAQPTSQDSA